jgi:prepilin-type N-terminal cleavage/methylation domain-containing protein/prepilin-type processing-associated H-X9-DG protein
MEHAGNEEIVMQRTFNISRDNHGDERRRNTRVPNGGGQLGNALYSRPKTAFTLIELLVVIAVVAVLVAILLPALIQARESSQLVRCGANLQQIGVGMHQYVNDYNGYLFPPVCYGPGFEPRWGSAWSVMYLVKRYAVDPKIFRCPSHFPIYQTNDDNLRSYIVNAWITGEGYFSDSLGNSMTHQLTYDRAADLHSADKMVLMYDTWHNSGQNGVFRENTIGEKDGNLCWQLWIWNNQEIWHMKRFLASYLFLDGHVRPYDYNYWINGDGRWPEYVYGWYIKP